MPLRQQGGTARHAASGALCTTLERPATTADSAADHAAPAPAARLQLATLEHFRSQPASFLAAAALEGPEALRAACAKLPTAGGCSRCKGGFWDSKLALTCTAGQSHGGQ